MRIADNFDVVRHGERDNTGSGELGVYRSWKEEKSLIKICSVNALASKSQGVFISC